MCIKMLHNVWHMSTKISNGQAHFSIISIQINKHTCMKCLMQIFGQLHEILVLTSNIRIYHEYEGRIEKSVPRITDWHHEACGVMTNGDHKGQIFLSHLHTNNRFFFLLTTYYLNYIGKNLKKPSRKS